MGLNNIAHSIKSMSQHRMMYRYVNLEFAGSICNLIMRGPQITFYLPDGRAIEAGFPASQTIGYLKAHLVRHYDFCYDLLELYSDGQELPDPFSLVDIGIVSGMHKTVDVVVNGSVDPQFADAAPIDAGAATIIEEVEEGAPAEEDYVDDFDTEDGN
jgi:hypothetical protein